MRNGVGLAHYEAGRWRVMNETLDEILAELKARKGIDFALYRREMVEGRVAVRMLSVECADLEAYLELLRQDPGECDALFDAFAIDVSSFFRNPIVFEILAQKVIPEILERKRAQGSREIRIWSAGCASGEEPYSMAILLREALEAQQPAWVTHILPRTSTAMLCSGPIGVSILRPALTTPSWVSFRSTFSLMTTPMR